MKVLSQFGFTILELAVAMTVLSSGSAVLWYALRSSARLEKLNQVHHIAFLAARTEVENLRLFDKKNIHDTSYTLQESKGISLMVRREVFDSARIVSNLSDVILDAKLSPLELKKPLEVRVSVYLLSEENAFSSENADKFVTDADNSSFKNKHALVILLLKIPEYQWY